MNIRTLFILFFATATSFGCGEKIEQPKSQPLTRSTCSSDEVINHVLIGFSRKLIEEGAKGLGFDETVKILSISLIKPIERDDERSYYKCSAVVSINYQSDLPERIAAAFSNHDLRRRLSERLEWRLGVVNGGGVFAQLNTLVSDGPHGSIPAVPEDDEIVKYAEIIQKNVADIFSGEIAVPIIYELADQRDADGNKVSEHRWYIKNREHLDLNVALLNMQSVIQEASDPFETSY